MSSKNQISFLSLLPRLVLAILSTLSLVMVVGSLSGCSDNASKKAATFGSMDVTGAPWGQTFSLPDLDGKTVTNASFPGKVTAVFFGFLYCPDACPTHLTKMQELKKRLGPDADRLQVVFVTVDPERDKPEPLRKFLASFDPGFVGLRGSREQTDAISKDFRVYAKKVETSASKKDPMAYTIDHTTFTYVYDTKGALRLVVPHDLAIEKLEADVRTLLSQAN
jgi:protein SCO1/2